MPDKQPIRGQIVIIDRKDLNPSTRPMINVKVGIPLDVYEELLEIMKTANLHDSNAVVTFQKS